MVEDSTQKSRTWTEQHQKLAEELSTWISSSEARNKVIERVRGCLEMEKRSIGDVERWLRRAIQDEFFREHIAGKQWSVEHQHFVDGCTAWITDADIRGQVISKVLPKLAKRKTPPKNPSYWIRRIINADFRKECKKRGMPAVNQWTDKTWSLAQELTAKQGIPVDMRDSIISHVWKKFVDAVEPIAKLENWMNNVIRSEYNTEIADMQGEGPVQWQVLTQVPGTKQQVDRELAAIDYYNKSRADKGPVDDPRKSVENKILLKKWREIHAKEGPLGRVSELMFQLHYDQDYTASEIAEEFRFEVDEIEDLLDHDHKGLLVIATSTGSKG